MRKLSHTEISRRRTSPDNVKNVPRTPIIAILDNIRSMYNVGSIFRTSDGALIEKLYLSGYTPTPDKSEVRKTALGAIESIPWAFSADPVPVLERLKAEGTTICLLEHTSKSVPYYEIRENIFPLCLVVGNELTGISEKILPFADCAVEIPMYGIKQSLNVAVAYGVVLFNFLQLYKQFT